VSAESDEPGQHLVHFAIANQRIAAYKGDVERLLASDERNYPVNEFITLEIA
jgi:hypothetical protein